MKDFFKIFLTYLIGIVSGVILFIALIIYSITKFSNQTNVIVAKDSYLEISLDKEVVEKPLDDMLGASKQITLFNILNAINVSKFDDKIKGIIINGDLTYLSKEHIYELYEVIKDFKDVGKKEVYSWFSTGDSNVYMLASLSNKIYMPETDSSELTLDGYSMVNPYYKDLFDKIGVGFTVVHIGDFKGSGDNYTDRNMNTPLKEHYINVMDDIYNNKIKFISNLRKINQDELDNLIKNGKTTFLTSKDSEKMKLIDGFCNYDELYRNIINNNPVIKIEDYIKTIEKKNHKDKLAIIYADGVITNYWSGDDFYEGSVVGSKTFIQDLDDIEKDDSIKAVLIRVNSPGGSALASELIYQKIKKLKEKKKVYISMGSIAASGGYYISCIGEKIFTTPFTITGSIGVVSMMLNYSKLSKNLGVNFDIIKKYKYDDLFATYREPTKDEVELLRNTSMRIYKEFTSHVIENRGIDKSKIESIAQGRIWSGTQAIELGLADYEGGLNSALNYIAKENNINIYSLVQYPKPENFIEKLKRSMSVKSELSLIKKTSLYKNLFEMYKLSTEGSLHLYLPFVNEK